MERDGQAVLHLQRDITEMLQTMAEPLGEVCSFTRRLLRRGLELQTSRCVNVFFLAKGQILFEQPSYVENNTSYLRLDLFTSSGESMMTHLLGMFNIITERSSDRE